MTPTVGPIPAPDRPRAGRGSAGPRGVRPGCRGREGQQSDVTETEESEGVEVGVTAEQPPVQARAVATVDGLGGERAQGVPRGDPVAADQIGLHRQVGGAQLTVGDAHHRCARHGAREVDPPVPGRVDLLPRLRVQVHAQMTGQPPLFGGSEGAEDLGRFHRPAPDGHRGVQEGQGQEETQEGHVLQGPCGGRGSPGGG